MVELFEHTAVLLKESVDVLVQNKKGFYLDGTFGCGGHSKEILNRLQPDGRLLAFDRDPEAVVLAKELALKDVRFEIKQTNFSCLEDFVAQNSVDGILLDLGVSSPQLDDSERGFSFMRNGPLDMRMNPEQGMSAAQWINKAEISEMVDVFKKYGEERFSFRIAKAIDVARRNEPITTTSQLSEIIVEAIPFREQHKHPATRVFQAVRIFINNELDELSKALESALGVLKVGGRLVVISFHSLEDRIVKRFIRSKEKGDPFPSKLPILDSQLCRCLKSCGKAVRASASEKYVNRRSRSAVMRVAQKLA